MAKSYTPAPKVPPEHLARYKVLLEVLSGEMTVSEGARRLNLSRNHFQTLMHRGLKGFVDELSMKPPGRPRTPAKEQQLRLDNERLKQENERLQKQVETTDRLLGLASGLLRGQLGRTKSAPKKADDAEDE
jgi:hypothetical protein